MWSYREKNEDEEDEDEEDDDEDIVTGIEQLHESHLTIFPNPSGGSYIIYLRSELLGNASVEALTINGQPTAFTFDQSSGTLNLQNAPEGFYIIRIITRDGTVTKKVGKL